MGHYDDAREAHEQNIRNKHGERLRIRVNAMTEDELGNLHELLAQVYRDREVLLGTYTQTSTHVSRLGQIQKMLAL